jgi:hypothetical protein
VLELPAIRETFCPLVIYEGPKHVGADQRDVLAVYYAHDRRISFRPANGVIAPY